MTTPDAVSNLFVESLKLSAKQRKVLDVIHEHPRGITAARIATIMGTTVNTLRGHLDELLAQRAIRTEAPSVGSRGRPALVYYSRVPDNRIIALEYITLVRVFAQYLSETTDDPQAAAYDIGRTWAREISTEPCDESELLVRLAQMGFDPVPIEEPHNLADTQPATPPLVEQSNARHPEASRAAEASDGTATSYPDHAGRPIIELRSCPFLHPHKETPAIVCDIHMGMLAARKGSDGRDFMLIPHHGDALCHVMVINGPATTTGTDNSPPYSDKPNDIDICDLRIFDTQTGKIKSGHSESPNSGKTTDNHQ